MKPSSLFPLGVWALSCTSPLPPENPKTQLDQPAEPVPIQVESTADLPASGPVIYRDVGFQVPESVLYDPTTDTYLVSNINGTPVAVDDNGFISRLSPDGSVQQLKFIDGADPEIELSAPKGLLIKGDTLLVTDIQYVRLFDLATGKSTGSWHFPEATFLNDLGLDAAGTVYVSDSGLSLGASGLEPNGSDALYKVETSDGQPPRISVFAKGKELEGPNGVLALEDGILMATFGSNHLTRFDMSGVVEQRVTLPTGGLDGIVRLPDGSLLVSSWQGQAVYRGSFTTPFEAVVTGVESPADIGFDPKRQRILVPLFMLNEVRAIPL